MPPPKSVKHPRLFVLQPDGTALEFLNEAMLVYDFRVSRLDKFSRMDKEEIEVNGEAAEVLTFLTEHDKRLSIPSLIEKEVLIPRSVMSASQTVTIPETPPVEVYRRREILKFTDID